VAAVELHSQPTEADTNEALGGQQTVVPAGVELGEGQAQLILNVAVFAVDVLVIVGVNPQLQTHGVLIPSLPGWLANETDAQTE